MKVVIQILLENGSYVYPVNKIPEDKFINTVYASIQQGVFVEIKTAEKEVKNEIVKTYNDVRMEKEITSREKQIRGEVFFNINPNKIVGYTTEEV